MKIFQPINIDINAELGAKNPRRVLPQVEGQMRVHRDGFVFEAVVVILLIVLLVSGLTAFSMPWPALIFVIFFLVVGCIKCHDNIADYRYQSAKAAAIRSKIKQETEQASSCDAEEAV